MRHCLIICALLLASCGHNPARVVVSPPPIPADLLVPCPGWTGPVPQTEGQFVDATAAERRGRMQCNAQIGAIAEIVGVMGG